MNIYPARLSITLNQIWSNANSFREIENSEFLKLHHVMSSMISHFIENKEEAKSSGFLTNMAPFKKEDLLKDNSVENSQGNNIMNTRVSENLAALMSLSLRLSTLRIKQPFPESLTYENIFPTDVIKASGWLLDKRFKQNFIYFLCGGTQESVIKIFRSRFSNEGLIEINNLDVLYGDATNFEFYLKDSQWLNLEGYCQIFGITPETLGVISKNWTDEHIKELIENSRSMSEKASFCRIFTLSAEKIQHLLTP